MLLLDIVLALGGILPFLGLALVFSLDLFGSSDPSPPHIYGFECLIDYSVLLFHH